MKLLFCPPQPVLTKKGKPRKRGGLRKAGRLFFADGREIEGVSSITMESEPQYIDASSLTDRASKGCSFISRLTIELSNPDVSIVTEAPVKKRTAA